VLLFSWRRTPEGWVCGKADVHCGPWLERVKVEFYMDELPRFGEEIRQLYHDLKGTAALDSIESDLTLRLTGNDRGAIEVAGTARSQFATSSELSFRFFIDQTFLPKIADSLCANSGR
jgi:hypothetical protein